MFRAISLASALAVTVATGDVLVDDDIVSLLQLRADGHHHRAHDDVQSGDGFGHEVKDSPLVDENKCDVWDNALNAYKVGVCPFQTKDDNLGVYLGSTQVITGVRFYAKQAGNFGLRFITYRNDFTLAEKSEEIEVPVAGVIQEYTLKKPLLLLHEDVIGFIHNGNGNIAYELADVGGPVLFRGDIGQNFEGMIQTWQEEVHGTCGKFATSLTILNRKLVPVASEKRVYSYNFITRDATKADLPEKMCLERIRNAGPPPQKLLDSLPEGPPPAPPPAPEPALPEPVDGDAAAAVGDPHLTTNKGNKFDFH